MTIPGGFKQVGSMMLESLLQGAAEDQAARDAQQQVRAQAYAQVLHGLGVKSPQQLTRGQHALADAIFRRMQGETTHGHGYGFSIPTEGRRPNWR